MANQYTKAPPDSQRDRILAFVRAHPECTTHDIRASLGHNLSRIGMYLTRLSNAGLVVAERTKGQRLGRWTAVDEEKVDDDKPKQIVSKQWSGTYSRDPLTAALFGKPQQQESQA